MSRSEDAYNEEFETRSEAQYFWYVSCGSYFVYNAGIDVQNPSTGSVHIRMQCPTRFSQSAALSTYDINILMRTSLSTVPHRQSACSMFNY